MRTAWLHRGIAFLVVLGACSDGGVSGTPGSEDALQHCVDVVNDYRLANGRAALTRSSALEDCATAGAKSDAATEEAHGHFKATSGCNHTANAENELPGWTLASRTVLDIIDDGTAMMMAEGPGGGHYENILRADATQVGCGVFVRSDNLVWVVQDFR